MTTRQDAYLIHLPRLTRATDDVKTAWRALAAAEGRQRTAIRRARRAGVPLTWISGATGISRSRLYEILPPTLHQNAQAQEEG